jgi:hypothetical protein
MASFRHFGSCWTSCRGGVDKKAFGFIAHTVLFNAIHVNLTNLLLLLRGMAFHDNLGNDFLHLV